jgi:predicted RNA-binding Zn ribbon-like protein
MANHVSNPVPEELELLGSFVNTLHKSIDAGTPDEEGLASPEALRSWMSEHGIPPGNDLRAKDLSSAIAFREALRGLLWANNGARLDPAALRALRNAAKEGLIQVEIDSEGRAAARPARTGVGALFARLLAVVADSQAAGTWERIKACAAEDCQWAFSDHSRNRSRAWCTMDVCGNRAKTRAYRARGKRI